MTVYLDTSVILRVLLMEPNPTELWGKWSMAFSSSLWRVEALRTIDRLRLIHEIDDAGVADVVGTLDAIHLASAMSVRERQPIDYFVTHDVQQATAARSLGFNAVETNI